MYFLGHNLLHLQHLPQLLTYIVAGANTYDTVKSGTVIFLIFQ